MIKPKIAQIHASPQVCWVEYDNYSYYKKNPICSKAHISNWKDLRGKNILNENIFITNFWDMHPFANPPIFINAKNVFFHYNYEYFTYYWLSSKIFPTKPTIYLNGDPCDSPVMSRGFKMFITEDNFFKAKRYAGEANFTDGITKENPLIQEIKTKDYEDLLQNFEIDTLKTEDYEIKEDKIKELTELDIEKNGGKISLAIFNNAKW